jgi:hypothetical protein
MNTEKDFNESQNKIETYFDNFKKFLVEKNKRYGNSASIPLKIFTKHFVENDLALDGILVRLDDKLSRIKNSDKLRENDVEDIMGYLALLCIHMNWNDPNKFLD